MRGTFRRIDRRGLCTAAIILPRLVTGWTNQQPRPHPTPPPTPSTSAESLVHNRADKPTQQDAPGIQFTTGSLEVTVNGHDIEIAADDWNTITDASVVAHKVGVSLDPDFHAAGTTR